FPENGPGRLPEPFTVLEAGGNHGTGIDVASIDYPVNNLGGAVGTKEGLLWSGPPEELRRGGGVIQLHGSADASDRAGKKSIPLLLRCHDGHAESGLERERPVDRTVAGIERVQ